MTRNRGDTDYNNNNYENNNKFERKLSRLFEDFLNDVGFTRTHGSKFRGESGKNINWSPAIDIKEVDREYLVVADVPGVRKEDIDIEFHDSVLILSGHLDQQDIYSTPQAQEINVGKDNRQPQQYPQHHYQQQQPQQFQQQQYQQQPQYQQSTEPNQYQQPQQQQQPPQPPPRQPQQYQQSSDPQQSTEAQQYQQAVDQKYNLSNEPQHHQQSQQPQQQSNEYQHIKHRRNNNENNRGERFHIQERPYGHFSRSIQLPSNIKSDDEFMATLENGILKIRIPKNNDKPRRKITIK